MRRAVPTSSPARSTGSSAAAPTATGRSSSASSTRTAGRERSWSSTTSASAPTPFREGREIVVDGSIENGVFVGDKDTPADQVPVEVRRRGRRRHQRDHPVAHARSRRRGVESSPNSALIWSIRLLSSVWRSLVAFCRSVAAWAACWALPLLNASSASVICVGDPLVAPRRAARAGRRPPRAASRPRSRRRRPRRSPRASPADLGGLAAELTGACRRRPR